MPRVVLLVRAILTDDACSPRAQSRRTVAIDAPRLGALLRGPRVLEPIDHVVDVQRLSAASRLQRVQLGDVVLDLLARGMLILAEPSLQTRQLQLRIEARSHACLVRVGQQSRWPNNCRSSRTNCNAADVRLWWASRVMVMVVVGGRWLDQRVQAHAELLLLQPRLEVATRLIRQVAPTSAQRG